MSVLNIFPVVGSAVSAQSQRLNTVASNLANADTTAGPDGKPYKARFVVFQSQAQEAVSEGPYAMGVKVVNVLEDQRPGARLYEPGNPMADDKGYVTHSNVNVIEQMVDMISASRAYENNVDVMNTAQQLAMKTLQMGQG